MMLRKESGHGVPLFHIKDDLKGKYIQRVQNAVAIVLVITFERGTSSGHRVNLSIIVRQYR